MAASEQLWRKLPTSLIRDEDMDLIADQLPEDLKAAPYMFYLTALCKADNDGIFDLEDGVIFARLMRLGSPAIVFQIANLMMKRKIILRAGNTTRCMLCNWDYSPNAKEAPRTMDQRRAIVARKIEEEQRQLKTFEFKVQEAAVTADFPASTLFHTSNHNDGQIAAAVAAATMINNVFGDQPANFLCADDDKNAENVVEKTQTERKIERLDTERIDTHTQTNSEIDTQKLALQAIGEPALRASTEEYTQKLQITEIEQENSQTTDGCMTTGFEPGEIESVQEKANGGEINTAVLNVLDQFFTKNNLAFSKTANYAERMALCNRIQALGDNRNPPEIVASVMLGQFKKLSEEDGYFKNMALTPQQLLTPGTYRSVLAAASKILLADKPTENWIKQQEKYAQEVEAEKAVGNVFDGEYLKYNIDPHDPQRAIKLMQIKANESKDDP